MPSPSCPPDAEPWISSPETVLVSSFIKETILTFIHLIGAYCILTRTPGTMQSVKWTLLNFHFWNVTLDLFINLLTVPITLFPLPAGILLGVLSWFGVKPLLQLSMVITCTTFVCVSTTMIFENRYHLLNMQNRWWARVRPLWVLGNYLFCFVFQIPIVLRVPDQVYAREMVLNILPCNPIILLSADIVIPSLEPILIVISSTIFIVVIFGQLIVFAIILTLQLSTNSGANMLSETTRRLQKNLMKALILQTGIPFLYLILPVCYTTFSFATDYFSMNADLIITQVISFHGLVSTLSIVLIHKPYRNAVVFWLTRNKTGDVRSVNPVPSVPAFTTNTTL